MSDVSPTYLRGLILPSRHVTYDLFSASASTLTQAGPRAGVPVAQQDTEMVLEATGDQAAGTTLIVKAQSSGNPQPSDPANTGGGSFVWRYSTNATTEWRGGGVRQLGYADYEVLDYTTTANKWKFPQIIRLANDSLLCVVTGGDPQNRISVFTKARDASAWTGPTTVRTNAAGVNAELMATAIQLPSGRVMVYAGDCTSIIASYSDDNGATWTRATWVQSGTDTGVALANHPTSHTTRRVRAAYLAGQVLLLVHTLDKDGAQNRDRIYQYASADMGATWDYVGITTGYAAAWVTNTDADQNSRGYPEITVINGQIGIWYVKIQNTTTFGKAGVYLRVLGSAYQSLQTVAEVSVYTATTRQPATVNATGSFGVGELAVVMHEDGVIQFLIRDEKAGNTEDIYSFTSNSGLATTTADSGTVQRQVHFNDAAKFLRDFSACSQLGRCVMAHMFTSDTDTHDPSLMLTYLGGYTSLAYNPTAFCDSNYLPLYLPHDVAGAWTKTEVGTPAYTLASGLLHLVCNAANETVYWTTAGAPSLALGFLDGKCSSPTQSSDGVYVRCVQTVGGSSYSVRFMANDSGLYLKDDNAAQLTTVTTAAAIAAGTNGVQLLLIVDAVSASCRAWWRASDLATKSDADHLWQDLGTFAGLTDGGAGTAAVSFGAVCSAAGGVHLATADIKSTSSGDSGLGGVQVLFAMTNPTDLFGRSFSTEPQYVDSGTRINSADGPAFYADQWQIPCRYDYGIENVHHAISPSPRKSWRSTGVAADVEVVWVADATLAERSYELGDTLGIALIGINFRVSYLYGWDTVGATWVLIATIDAADGQNGLLFTRAGDSIIPYAGGATGRWFAYNALADCYAMLNNGAGTIVTRKIVTNAEGGWGGASLTATKQARIQIAGAVNTDTTGGGAGPTMHLISKDVCVLAANADKYSKFKLKIPAQPTCEGYFQIGEVIVGHAALFGKQYSRGGRSRRSRTTPSRRGSTGRAGRRAWGLPGGWSSSHGWRGARRPRRRGRGRPTSSAGSRAARQRQPPRIRRSRSRGSPTRCKGR